MSALDETRVTPLDHLRAAAGILSDLVTSDWFLDELENQALDSGQLRYGSPSDWYRSIRWSRPAWAALHGAEGPRGRA